jgi:Ring finger domain
MSSTLCSLCWIRGMQVPMLENGSCPCCLASTNYCAICAQQGQMVPFPDDAEYCPRCEDEDDYTDDDEEMDGGYDSDEEGEVVELPSVIVSAEDLSCGVHSGCTVCCSDYGEGEEVAVLPCQGKHRFHIDCIGPWLVGGEDCNKCCPNCREKVRD